ncbi:hypothetical protein ACQSME_03520 [Streptomyces sp. 2-6]|uniref:hypothetical protein n=1 Tax=Streptomyces sp. 2-6 TaxID=2978333 RepID=UPI003D096CBC
MPTITAVLPHAVHAPAQAPYEDWRPPIHGVSLLIPVGADALAVADLRSLIMLPTGTVSDGQTPEQAARDLLLGAPDGLPALRATAPQTFGDAVHGAITAFTEARVVFTATTFPQR